MSPTTQKNTIAQFTEHTWSVASANGDYLGMIARLPTGVYRLNDSRQTEVASGTWAECEASAQELN